jgi:hypothetical protein
MIIIPIRWVPYVLVILGILGIIVLAMRGQGSDKVFGIVVCALCAIGGIIWEIMNQKRRIRNKE